MMFCDVGRRRAGFTLIEIMIVIAIIAILAGIVVPNFMQARAESQLAACRQNILALADSIQMVLMRHSAKPIIQMISPGYAYTTSGLGFPEYLIDNGYLQKMPKCPNGDRLLINSTNGYDYQLILRYSDGKMHGDLASVLCWCVHNLGGKVIRPRYDMGNDGLWGWHDFVYDL